MGGEGPLPVCKRLESRLLLNAIVGGRDWRESGREGEKAGGREGGEAR